MFTCARCGRKVDPEKNLGTWGCAQHANEAAGGVHPCCGAAFSLPGRRLARGCVPADHTHLSVPWSEEHDVRLSAAEARARAGQILADAVVGHERRGHAESYLVRRFDAQKADRRAATI